MHSERITPNSITIIGDAFDSTTVGIKKSVDSNIDTEEAKVKDRNTDEMDNITRKANKRVHDLRSDIFEEQNKEYTKGYDCNECFKEFMRKIEGNISQTSNRVKLLEIIEDNKKTKIED